MDFQQKRKGYELSWQIAEEGINGCQQDSTGRREFHIPFENISIQPTLQSIPKPKKSLIVHTLFGSVVVLFLAIPIITVVVALLPINDDAKAPVSGMLLLAAMWAWLFFFSRKRPGLRYISTAFNSNTKPFFWFFLPDAQENERLSGFLDQVYQARNAFFREKYLPQVQATKTPQDVHELVMTLLREQVINDAEFEGFKNRFCPQKTTIGFSSLPS